MDPLLLAIGLLSGTAVTLFVLYSYQRTAPARIARQRLVPRRRQSVGLAPALRDARSRVPGFDRLPISSAARDRMETQLDRAGVPLRVTEFLGARVVAALAAGLLGVYIGDRLLISPIVSLVIALVLMLGGWLVPRMLVERSRRRRMRRVDAQLPEALTIVAKSLRAGGGLVQAIAYAAQETPAPLGPELARVLRDLRLGADPETVFTELAARVESRDLDIAVTAIIIQRTVGGNLAEILGNVGNTIRERERLRREVLVMTSRQRLTAYLMAMMPVLVGAAYVSLNPEAGRVLYEETAGQIALGVGLFFELVGFLIIRRLSAIEV